MDNLLKLLCLLFVCALFASCNLFNSEDPTNTIQRPIDFSLYAQDTTKIIGTWDWIRSTAYYTSNEQPYTVTPNSTGSTKKLIIKDDSTIEMYLNNELQWNRSIEDYLSNQVWGVRKDTLAISAAHRDGAESVYIRIE